ncbi:MAG: DUF89 family protein [Lachnospiraceae bacterium]|nr:DUF89 family protein [Lachnospiraceae bacterium]
MEIRRLHPECIRCMTKVHLEKCPQDMAEEIKVEYMQKVLKILAEAPAKYGAPIIVRTIQQLQEEMLGIKQEYAQIKKHYNALMMQYEEQVLEHIVQSEDPIKTGIQYAMIGNYIDFGARITVTEEHLTELLNTPERFEVDQKQYEELTMELEKAKKLVYLTDNCGEIVMDKLLIKQIKNKYPDLDITVMVRGAEVINDATIEDAKQVGLNEIVKVIPNGSDIAGTWIEEISEEAKKELYEADIIISKGQGNFETLRKCGKNIYYIFLCKCDLFANIFQVPKLTGMLINEKYC